MGTQLEITALNVQRPGQAQLDPSQTARKGTWVRQPDVRASLPEPRAHNPEFRVRTAVFRARTPEFREWLLVILERIEIILKRERMQKWIDVWMRVGPVRLIAPTVHEQ